MPIRSLLFFLLSGLAFAAPAPTFPVLAYSTYLRDSFTPNAIATDASGNIYLAGSATIDPATMQTTALIVKLNPQATQYLYVRYIGGSVYDSASAIAVDSAGNAYVAGVTGSPDFPVTAGGNLGAAPSGVANERSFVAKLDPTGELVFSDLLGGPAASQAQAVAVTTTGQIIVSGTSVSAGFPNTAGAYSIANSANHPYLLELDPTGTKLVFSATGIGGSALAFDSSGNIYAAGSTYLLDYPTTPGVYQTAFPVFTDCTPPCAPGGYQGQNQYVSKVDPSGSKLIFSTSVSGTYNTTNGGLAVDSAGDVFLTGFEGGNGASSIPGVIPGSPFLTKLDPAGQKLLFSVPVGGAGVQLDSNGSAYVGGMAGIVPGPIFGYQVTSLPALTNVPGQCLPNNTFIKRSAYAAQVDATTGNLLGTQFIGGSTIGVSGVALTGSTLWLAGGTNLPDFPFSTNALTLPSFPPGPLPGAYLGAVDFSQPQPPAGTPQIACIADAADLASAGPVATYQLLTIFGTGLGPATPAGANNNTTTTLGGVSVNFGSTPAPLLYVSSTQINFAVPAGLSTSNMHVTANGVSTRERAFPTTFANPSLFLDLPDLPMDQSIGYIAVALNADGSVNSPSNPAPPGSIVSVFLNGLSPAVGFNGPNLLFANNGWTVTGFSQATPYVLQVDLQVPATLQAISCGSSSCAAGFSIYYTNPGNPYAQPVTTSAVEVGGAVYITN